MAILATGCGPGAERGGAPLLATTTSYLEAAARDLLGHELRVLRLAEPGTCPGHFDIRPGQVQALRRCRALLRFDFQKSLDARFAGDGTNGPAVAEITLSSGLGVPATYLAACRQTAAHLVALGLLPRADADARLEAIRARLEELARDATNQVARAGLVGAPVLASARQREFAEWLGFKVVATFRPADTASIGEIEDALAAGKLAQVRLVLANLPEGRRAADVLAERLKARVVVWESFPALRQGRLAFDDMFKANVEALLHGR